MTTCSTWVVSDRDRFRSTSKVPDAAAITMTDIKVVYCSHNRSASAGHTTQLASTWRTWWRLQCLKTPGMVPQVGAWIPGVP